MKTVTYSILRQKISSITQYAGENEVTKLILDYTGLHTENWEKWVDLKMADGTTSFRFLGFDSVVEMLFTSAHTKFGSLYVQPYARLDDKKFMYDIGTLRVDESLLVTSDTSVITDDFIQYIDQMFDDYYTKLQIDGFLNAKQETLMSGINIKTINNISVLGSGNIDIVGGTGTDKNYIHEQMSPSNIWTINHNMNKFPSVQIVNNFNEVVIGDVIFISANQITVHFSGSFSGKAYLN